MHVGWAASRVQRLTSASKRVLQHRLRFRALATEGQSGEGKASTSQAVAAGTATTEPPFVKPTLVNKLQLVGLGLAVVMLVQTFVQLNLAEQTAITGDRRDGTGTGTGTGQSESTDFEVGNPIDCKPTDA